MIGDGSQEAYEAWITNPSGGRIERDPDVHDEYIKSYTFDEATKKFTYRVYCRECDEQVSIHEIDGGYIKDVDASCTADEVGHYTAYVSEFDTTLATATGSTVKPGTKHPHHPTHHEAEEPTCTVDGLGEYYYCDECKQYFSDPECTSKIDDISTLITPALGHNLKHVDAKAAIGDDEGNIEYYQCERCGKCYLDEAGTIEIKYEDTIISAPNHKLVHVAAVRPTCTESGLQEYYYCAHCDKYYTSTDESSVIEDFELWCSELGEGYIAPKGHLFDDNVTYKEHGKDVTTERECTREDCTFKETETKTARVV